MDIPWITLRQILSKLGHLDGADHEAPADEE
jgi:hypothetical protein